MAHIQKIPDASGTVTSFSNYERLLSAMGTEEFGQTVRDAVRAVTAGVRRLYLFEAESVEVNLLQYFDCEPALVELLPTYSKSYLPIDPVVEGFVATPRPADLALQRVRPADISSRSFRRRFFEDGGIIERVSIIQRGPKSWRVMNLARHQSDGYFSDDQLDSLIELSRIVLPMLPYNRRREAQMAQLTVTQIEQRFAARFPGLTVRERQVCARAVIGMTVEGTSLDLGIAKTSVLTYRQRAYQRLSISSPYELCSLVSN